MDAAALHTAAVCPPGAFGPACTACPAGSYCPGGSSMLNKQSSPAPVISCPDHTTSPAGASSAADCVCTAGYGGAACQMCPAGSFSEGGSRQECQKCDPGQSSIEGAPSRDYCHCRPGQDADCATCARGTWSDQGVCNPCPTGRTSDVGATSADQCCELTRGLLDCVSCVAVTGSPWEGPLRQWRAPSC